jgi:hypothetical protein
MVYDAVNNMVDGAMSDKYPILRFFARENRATELRGIDIAGYSRVEDVIVDWLLEHSSALKDYNITKEILYSEEEKAVAIEALHQWDVLLNATIKADEDAEIAAIED